MTRVAVTLATVLAASAPAHAATRLLILLDGSGSMTTARATGDRFDAAIAGALTEIHNVEIGLTPATSPLLVAVYTFQGASSMPASRTAGFVTSNDARDALQCLRPPSPLPAGLVCSAPPFEVTGGTPLAGAMCGAADALVGFSGDTKILHVSSDGEENSTTGGCGGVNGTFDPRTGWSAGSWQANVISHFTGTGIATTTNLFAVSGLPLVPFAPDPEGFLAPEARSLAVTAAASTGLTPLEQFFTSMALATGGHLTVIHDDEPLPVPGDLDGDRCVDHRDAILVARGFGPVAPPIDGAFDLNFDGKVDFADYLIEVSRATSTCGPDVYVPRAPVVCKGAKRIVIDGEVIEDGGLTIDARGACQITIKDSLIVSGKNAITIVGSALVTVDHSTIVGQDAVISQHGASVLSAANSVFHGTTDVDGTFQYIDRGGNVFE